MTHQPFFLPNLSWTSAFKSLSQSLFMVYSDYKQWLKKVQNGVCIIRGAHFWEYIKEICQLLLDMKITKI